MGIPSTEEGEGQADMHHTILKPWQGLDQTNLIWVMIELTQNPRADGPGFTITLMRKQYGPMTKNDVDKKNINLNQ